MSAGVEWTMKQQGLPRGRPKRTGIRPHFVDRIPFVLHKREPVTYHATVKRPNRVWHVEVRESEYKAGKWVFEISTPQAGAMISEYDYKTTRNAANAAQLEVVRWDTELDFKDEVVE